MFSTDFIIKTSIYITIQSSKNHKAELIFFFYKVNSKKGVNHINL